MSRNAETTSKENHNENSSSSDTETQLINLSLRGRSRQRKLIQSFSYNAIPVRIVGEEDAEPITANPSSMRDMTLSASQIIDDSSDIDVDTDYYISNDSSSDGESKKHITFPGRPLVKTDCSVRKTIQRRKTQRKLILYKTM